MPPRGALAASAVLLPSQHHLYRQEPNDPATVIPDYLSAQAFDYLLALCLLPALSLPFKTPESSLT
jgi:hypothetical protein